VIQLSENNIETLLQKILPYFFTLVFITTIVGALSGYLEHNSWKMGDWLINYQGGMVRRGLLGEVIYQLALLTHLNPGLYVVAFQAFFYAVFLFFSYALLKKQHALLPYALLIFSPFIFTFQINDLQGGFRKEIIYLALLSFVVWTARTRDPKTFEKVFYIILLLYPAVILTHEMLAIYLPFLLVAYLSSVTLTRKKFFFILLLLTPSIVSFLVAIYYSGTSIQVVDIFNSIAKENYPLTGGAISWLDRNSSYGIALVTKQLNEQHYAYYILLVPLAALAYIPIHERLKSIAKNRLSLFLILISIVGSAGLFIVAIDWGRFIYITLVSIFLLSLISTQDIEVHHQRDRYNQPVNLFIALFFSIYSLFWHIPHCCSIDSTLVKNYKQINIVLFAKPYAKVLFYIFPNLKSKIK
jgi:hypothetical protein